MTKETKTGKYRAEKDSYTLRIYNRKNNREVFSYTVNDDPCYAHDTRDWGEVPSRMFFNDYAVSPDEKHVLLAIEESGGGCWHEKQTSSSDFYLFEIETGERCRRKFESSSKRFSLSSVSEVDFSSDGKFVRGSFHDRTNASDMIVLVWNFESGRIVKKTTKSHLRRSRSGNQAGGIVRKITEPRLPRVRSANPVGERMKESGRLIGVTERTDQGDSSVWKWVLGGAAAGLALFAGNALIKRLYDNKKTTE
ncbi:hypothetical protein QUF72_00655 [Desulfobacterales bacterium HSG2]|nr:hypothetical protein [Desulfobacterales bacterium HSG2]MDM8548546.1 hypothetical protein [Desulfobacterales bacterium HSG2]